MTKRYAAKEIANNFGRFIEGTEKYGIDTGKEKYLYRTLDELLCHWLEVIVSYDASSEGYYWTDIIEFILENCKNAEIPGVAASVNSRTGKKLYFAFSKRAISGTVVMRGPYASPVDAYSAIKKGEKYGVKVCKSVNR